MLLRFAGARAGGAGAVAALLALAAGSAAEARGLYAPREPLELTLVTPVRALGRPAGRRAEHTAVARFADGHEIPARIVAYGKSRLETCRLPPLEIRLDPAAAAGSIAAGHTLRLVSPCRGHAVYEKPLLLEYLTYRAWAEVAPVALGARLVRVHWEDADGRAPTETRLGFLVEDIGEAAARLGASWSTVERHGIGELEPDEASLHALFQLMVGNTDWSVIGGPEGERCCHNVALLESLGAARRRILPYDFDQSGLVAAPYAAPDKTLGITDVRQRVYRGFCVHNDALQAAIDHLNSRRDELEALFLDPALPQEKARLAAWRYVGEFFELVNQPKKLEAMVIRRCRS